MVKPTCSIDGCTKPTHARGWCPMHYMRWHTTGDTGTAEKIRQPVAGLVCEVEGCEQPMRKYPWCAGHYSQRQRKGDVSPFGYKWAQAGQPCPVCGKPTGDVLGYRKFCSSRCRAFWGYHGGVIPTAFTCVCCGQSYPLDTRGKGGYRKRKDTRLCRRCRLTLRKHGMSVGQLAARDGIGCKLCGLSVDLLLPAPHPGCPSIDHITPRALGGTNDPANLQLTHLRCNVHKGVSLTA